MIDPGSVAVTCSAHILLPKLIPSEGITMETAKAWEKLLARMREHELNHVLHAARLAPAIKRKISGSSKALRPTEGNTIGFSTLREMRILDRAYDTRTNHGATEGIWSDKINSALKYNERDLDRR